MITIKGAAHEEVRKGGEHLIRGGRCGDREEGRTRAVIDQNTHA